MSDVMRTANYGQEDTSSTITVYFERLTTTELTALATARKVGIGKVYYDTTLNGFKLGVDHSTVSGVLTTVGLANAIALTGGTIDGVAIGSTTRSTGRFTALNLNSTDSSGTPGNVTNNSSMGRAAFAAAGTAVTVTNSTVVASSIVQVQVMGSDATLTTARVTSINAGNFVVTGNAAATGITPFNFVVINV